MFCERTSVGLDVHARSVVAAAIDGRSGEVFRARLTPSHAEVIEWVGKLPGPCAVVYESGPTGFGLARALSAAGLRCEVAASSKLHRPAGDRVKTDARDALHLARLLRLDEVVPVRMPSAAEEAARDLVRAREGAAADLMRARHRLSKLLLRHGIVYSGGKAWTELHDRWLLRQRFDAARDAGGVRGRVRDGGAGHRPPGPAGREDHRAGRGQRVHPAGAAAGVPARDLDVDRVRAGGRDRRLGPVHRREHRRLPGAGAQRALLRARAGRRARSPRPATLTCAGCWSRPPGTTAAPTGPARCCGAAGSWPRPRPGPGRRPVTSGCTRAGSA